jgi:hypothetical protein
MGSEWTSTKILYAVSVYFVGALITYASILSGLPLCSYIEKVYRMDMYNNSKYNVIKNNLNKMD